MQVKFHYSLNDAKRPNKTAMYLTTDDEKMRFCIGVGDEPLLAVQDAISRISGSLEILKNHEKRLLHGADE